MLVKLPPEVLDLVIEKEGGFESTFPSFQRCACSCCQSSLAIYHDRAVERISPTSHCSRGLPRARLQLAMQLHFHSDVQYATKERCPHVRDYENPWDTDEDKFEYSGRKAM
ncbi:hypothetical protein F4781DRAFT_29909 [Annulohypoxylon bovei var. microspora]|nr:hypothetical protein F4781DRAFT_29909 [Annulohypoxylon bovei var. microspora]